MSRKKYSDQDSKVELYEGLIESLLQIYSDLESAEVRYSELEHTDYINLVIRPFEDLISSLEVFKTNLDNDFYSIDIEEEFENNED